MAGIDARDVLFSAMRPRRKLFSRIAETVIYAFGAASLLGCGWLAANALLGRSPW